MQTMRFDGPTLDETVRSGMCTAGPGAKVVGATVVRRGGIGGFFTTEHVEVEVEVPLNQEEVEIPVKQETVPPGREVAPPRREALRPRQQEALRQEPGPPRQDAAAAETTASLPSAQPPSVELTEPSPKEPGPPEWQQSQPAPPSWAALPSRAALPSQADHGPSASEVAARPALTPSERRPTSNAAVNDMLERIATKVGLVAPVDLLDPPSLVSGDELDFGHTTAAPATAPMSRRPGWLTAAPVTQNLPERRLVRPGEALEALGLPANLCRSFVAATSLQALEAELVMVLKAELPPLPAIPRSPGSVVALVGEPNSLMACARALAAEIGADPGEIALAARHKVWRANTSAISSPAEAREQLGSWRRRPRPTVVAIEQQVGPFGNESARRLGFRPACPVLRHRRGLP